MAAIISLRPCIIKTRGAALIIIRCNETITRELYTGTERCVYSIPEYLYKIMVAISIALLMVVAVLLRNCE